MVAFITASRKVFIICIPLRFECIVGSPVGRNGCIVHG